MNDQTTAKLILKGDQEDRVIVLGREIPSRIGRSVRCEIVLQGEGVSRHHAIVQYDASGIYSILDLNSRNGTYLNGQRLNGSSDLHDGDILKIGDFTLAFVHSGSGLARPDVATMSCGETLPTLATAKITVLVIDVRDFTVLSRKLGDMQIAAVMTAFNREAGAILDKSGAWGWKHIGDAVMAVWAHQAHQTPLFMVRTALAAIAEIHESVQLLQDRFDLTDPILIGAGLNTGTASIGNLGSGAAADYTALGDVVNKAFRLESSTRQLNMDIAFGEEVEAVLSEVIDVGESARLQQVQLKGYDTVSGVYSFNLDGLAPLIKLLDARLPVSEIITR